MGGVSVGTECPRRVAASGIQNVRQDLLVQRPLWRYPVATSCDRHRRLRRRWEGCTTEHKRQGFFLFANIFSTCRAVIVCQSLLSETVRVFSQKEGGLP